MKKLVWMGMLSGVVLLGAGCKTMAAGTGPDHREPAPPPTMGGAGLDPNPDHNMPNGPGATPP